MSELFTESIQESLQQTSEYLRMLRGRIQHCCCKYCGGALEVKQITYSNCQIARFELVCCECRRLGFGVEKEIYDLANVFVNEYEFDHFPQMEETHQKNEMNVAKICDIINWSMTRLGLLSENGFETALYINQIKSGESVIFTDDELE